MASSVGSRCISLYEGQFSQKKDNRSKVIGGGAKTIRRSGMSGRFQNQLHSPSTIRVDDPTILGNSLVGHRRLYGRGSVTLNAAVVVVHPLPAMLFESILLYSCCAHEFLVHHGNA